MAAAGQALRVSSQRYGAVDQMSHASAEGYFATDIQISSACTGAIVPDHMTNGEEPSAPPAYPIDEISGYEGTALGDGGGKGLPPPSNLVTDRGGGPSPAQTDWNIPAVSEDAAKEALIQYAASKCCYSSAPAKEMVFQNLQPFNTYRYRLETFTESRSSEWKTTPYRGEFVDSFLLGPAPLPWNIQVEVPTMFTDNITRVKVPHTSSLKGCHNCRCAGTIHCTKCHGRGKVQCWICHGSGNRLNEDRCTHCSGSGRSRCNSCSGSGHKTCITCAGKGQLLYYIELQVKWKNNIFEYVADQRSGFPADLFKEVTGQKMFVDEQSMVYPVVNFPDPSISQASQNAVVQHHTQFASTSRVLRQRQTIELIPLTKVEYDWQGKWYSYYVYGDENRVYAENYPKKCCCLVM
ncbi:protein SSUH2 homolog isoform X4 [Dermochelys coriacea]|uniref:protein SSUH2 homolog isoform X4 n=1 Tax=Dermochelys coriacea TaxID=27794 RepID=UPI001CA9255D|nr:protein SSUH2 homolog isoform X4 [Dermochelys coriacea]